MPTGLSAGHGRLPTRVVGFSIAVRARFPSAQDMPRPLSDSGSGSLALLALGQPGGRFPIFSERCHTYLCSVPSSVSCLWRPSVQRICFGVLQGRQDRDDRHGRHVRRSLRPPAGHRSAARLRFPLTVSDDHVDLVAKAERPKSRAAQAAGRLGGPRTLKVFTLTFTGLFLVLVFGLLLLHQIAVPGLLGISFVMLFVGLVAVYLAQILAGDATEMVKERPRRFKYTWMRTAEDRAKTTPPSTAR